MGVRFHMPVTIDFNYLLEISPALRDEVLKSQITPLVWTLSETTVCTYYLFSICKEKDILLSCTFLIGFI